MSFQRERERTYHHCRQEQYRRQGQGVNEWEKGLEHLSVFICRQPTKGVMVGFAVGELRWVPRDYAWPRML